MKTKTIFLALILSLVWTTQTSAQFKIGVEAGYLNNHYSISSALTTQSQHSFLAGIIVSYTIRDIGWLETGLTFQRKGFDFEPSYTDAFSAPVNNINMDAYHLDVPLLMGLKFNLSEDMSIIPKMGGFLSYGLKATASFTGETRQGEPFSVEYNAFTELHHSGNAIDPSELRYEYNRIDAGVQVGLDFMWKQYAVRGAYKFGLINDYFFESQVNSRTFSIAIAYYFLNK